MRIRASMVRVLVVAAFGVAAACSQSAETVQKPEGPETVFLLPDCDGMEEACIPVRIGSPCETGVMACERIELAAAVPRQPYDGTDSFTASISDETGSTRDVVLSAYAAGSPCGADIFLAVRGVAEGGNLLVQSDAGEMELLLSATWTLPLNIVLIDAESGDIQQSYLVPDDRLGGEDFNMDEPGRAYMRGVDGTCWRAIGSLGGRAEAVDASHCLERTGGTNGRVSPSDEEVAMAARALPEVADRYGDRFASLVSHLKDRPELVVDLIEPCT